jgi:uncharacterized protein
LMEAHFEDTILIKTLTKRIYYKVITFDKHNNASEYSDILEVMKPDLVAPVTPVIHNYYVSAGSVAIEWHVSSSDDVKLQALYRKEIGGVKDYTFITNLDPQTNKYRDGEVIRGKSYEYMLQAIDSSGLKSEFSYPLHVSVYGQSTLPQVKNLKVSKDKTSGHIHIDWDYSTTDVPVKFVLYRSNDSNIEQYKYTSDHKYVDSLMPYTDKVTYAVKAISDDGAESELSDTVTLKIEK